MKNPFVQFARRWALRHLPATPPTSLLPMSDIHSAVVYVDGQTTAEDPEVAGRIARRLLADRDIEVRVLCPRKDDLDWLGRIKPAVRGSTDADLFLSLVASPDDFTATYEACCSTARFKVGRCMLPGRVYDLVLDSPEQEGPDIQAEALPALMELLDKIR